MSSAKKFIHDLKELYKKFLQDESIETESVDLFLQDIEQQAEENRKKILELGFWVEDYEEKNEGKYE